MVELNPDETWSQWSTGCAGPKARSAASCG